MAGQRRGIQVPHLGIQTHVLHTSEDNLLGAAFVAQEAGLLHQLAQESDRVVKTQVDLGQYPIFPSLGLFHDIDLHEGASQLREPRADIVTGNESGSPVLRSMPSEHLSPGPGCRSRRADQGADPTADGDLAVRIADSSHAPARIQSSCIGPWLSDSGECRAQRRVQISVERVDVLVGLAVRAGRSATRRLDHRSAGRGDVGEYTQACRRE